MSKLPDEVLKKILNEIQTQAIASQQHITTSQIQRQAKEKEKKISELIFNELSKLTRDTPVYSSAGKAFIKEDLNQIEQKLTTQIKEINNEIDALNKKIIYHETTLANTQPHIERIMNS
ncbi:hypothetical protein PNEG_01629 [Pneumocystis murina B123]|uniref:F-box domain-containing protein n=1 Tax=Pneumocystis murina (strain B123) TaxID=1069680 RepID=M7NSX2_PNEMU|nr:hypothetical protein PNEG_01629 [Pneumocystis murina B123]EMR10377.1 hypothetical protein PNEG_01629 [Pneumocystis murina B123]